MTNTFNANANSITINNGVNNGNTIYSVLVPHKKYWVYNKDLKEIVLFVAASETFNKKNINCLMKNYFDIF